jgi:microsomal dipeptidase-like Zn-dependent dipeptidase
MRACAMLLSFVASLCFDGLVKAETADERIERLHRDSTIIVAHDHTFLRQNFQQMRQGGVTAKTVMLTTDLIDWNTDELTRFNVSKLDDWKARFERHLGEVEALTRETGSNISIAKSVGDIRRAKRTHDGRVVAIIGSEGILHLDRNDWRAAADAYYTRGWRQTQIGHTGEDNRFIYGGRLTREGIELVCYCNQKGIVIDLEHQNLPFVQDVVRVSAHPLLYSHDVPKEARTTDGNPVGGQISDDVLFSIINSGKGKGVLGMHFFQSYYGGAATLPKLVNGAKYVMDFAGTRGIGREVHVVLGADFFPENDSWAIKDLSEMKKVTAAFVTTPLLNNYQFTDDEIRGILGENLLSLYDLVWKGGA